nr:JAB domain-containing protein [uncultured Mediterraneibacter sp.]
MNNKEIQDSLKQVGIRLVEEPPLLSPEPMNNPEAAVRVLGKWLSEMDRELFCVVNLNTNLTPINMNVVSMGALNMAYVHPRETMKSAILSNSAYLMLVHNHLGSLNPSKEDIEVTDRIQSAASLMGIPVLDHIIVGRNQEFFSLRENNVFSFENDISYTSEQSKLQWTQQMGIAEQSAYRVQEKEAAESKLDTIMKALEEGVEKVFTSEQYQMYLQTMAKFHNYSFNNTLLIAMQRPDATLLAGYQTWQKKFHRHVKRGEKGIKIIAPVPVKEKRQVEKIDEETQEIVIGIDGQPETETVERILPRFRVTTVFDISQTEGEPLPTLEVNELVGDVFIYEDFMKGLEEISPVPFQFQEIDSGAKGYYSNAEKLVAIQTGMSQAQTMKTAVHETAHAILHDRDVMEENGITKDRMTKEVESESVAYVVCNHFGLDTSDYSFNYVAGWSSDKEMPELRSSMDTIRLTSSQLIADITEKLLELQKTRELENDIKTEELAEESSFLSHTENSYAIYQYRQADDAIGYQYMSLDFIEKMGMSVKGSDYQMMYQGVLEAQDTLEDLYIKFNIDRPEGFKGHSMSTSDVVILKRDGEMKAYYVNDIGFRELPEFIEQRAEVLRETNSGLVVKQDKFGKEQEEPEKIREDRTITETIQSNVSKKKNQQMQAGLHR